MRQLLEFTANASGVGGIVVCFTSAVVRLAGGHAILGHDPLAYFIVGVGLIATGCFLKMHLLELTRWHDRPVGHPVEPTPPDGDA